MQFFNVNGCVHLYTFNHTSSFPQRALFVLLFYNLYEVTDRKHETEEDEAIIVQPNPWLASKRHEKQRVF